MRSRYAQSARLGIGSRHATFARMFLALPAGPAPAAIAAPATNAAAAPTGPSAPAPPVNTPPVNNPSVHAPPRTVSPAPASHQPAGHVEFSCFVARDGAPRNCRIESVSGGPAYADIVNTWLRGGYARFSPALKGNTPVGQRQTFSLDFGPLPQTK